MHISEYYTALFTHAPKKAKDQINVRLQQWRKTEMTPNAAEVTHNSLVSRQLGLKAIILEFWNTDMRFEFCLISSRNQPLKSENELIT